MKRYLFVLFISAIFSFASQGVFGPIQTLPSSYAGSVNHLYSTYNPKDHNVFMTWADTQTNPQPWFAIYNPKSATFLANPTKIENIYFPTIVNSFFVTSCYIASNNSMFISWAAQDGEVWYAVYDCKSLQYLKEPGPGLSFYKVKGDIYSCYNPRNNTVFISFTNAETNNQYPVYGILDCKNNAFSTLPKLLSNYFRSNSDVIPLYNTSNNTIFLTWADEDSSNPYFAIFDCSTGTLSKGPTQIDKDKYTKGVFANLYTALVEKDNQIFLSWCQNEGNGGVWYAIYDANRDKMLLEPTSLASSFSTNIYPQNDVIPCYYPANNTVFFSWGGITGNYFSVYDWSTQQISEPATLIPNTTETFQSNFDVQPLLIEKRSRLFLSWSTAPGLGAFRTYVDKKTGIKKIFNKQKPIDYQRGIK